MCGDEPGEFVWQSGVVTQAVAEGRWLLLEDIDRAPLEVMCCNKRIRGHRHYTVLSPTVSSPLLSPRLHFPPLVHTLTSHRCCARTTTARRWR